MTKKTESTPEAIDADVTKKVEAVAPGNVTEFPGFSAQKFEVPDQVREMAEQGVEL